MIKTGEEDEDVILKMRIKLYRFRDEEWKERGKGNGKLLRHKETHKIRFLLRQDGTLKVMANFLRKNTVILKSNKIRSVSSRSLMTIRRPSHF